MCLQMSLREPGPGSVNTVREVGYTSDRAVIIQQYGEKDSPSLDQVFGEKVSPDQVKNNIKGLVICLRFVL